MDRHACRPRFRNRLHQIFRFTHHKVYIQRHVGVTSQSFDNRHSVGQVVNKVPVHHVDVDPVGAVPAIVGKKVDQDQPGQGAGDVGEPLARMLADAGAGAATLPIEILPGEPASLVVLDLVEAHGGDPDPDRLPLPEATHEIPAEESGYVAGIAADTLGRVAATVGAGRSRRDEPLAFGAGVTVHARLGEAVEPGQPLATLEIGDREADVAGLSHRIATAFEISATRREPPELVLGTVDEVDPSASSHR